MNRRHVVLITYGEPPGPGFRAQLRYSWRILLGLTRTVADIPAALLPLLALVRAFSRVSLWRHERFESPLEPLTHAQADGLAAALAAAAPEIGWSVHVAYEFRNPLLHDVLAGLPEGEPVDIVPMYAIDSAFTHQLSRDAIAAGPAGEGRGARARVLPALAASVLADLAARHLRRELELREFPRGPETALVLAAHGTLLDPPRPYDTGRVATEDLAQAITERLHGEFGAIALGWLNHSFGGRWTEPSADEALRRMSALGYRRLVYFPFGFLADNAETLLEGRLLLRGVPELQSIQLPCWNAAPELMEALAHGILAADASPPARRAGPNRRLDQLEPGERSVILQIKGNSGLERRLMELGLVPGTTVEVVRRAPFGDPVEVRVRNVHLSLRRSETSRIHVARD